MCLGFSSRLVRSEPGSLAGLTGKPHVSTETGRADPLLIRANKLDLIERLAEDLAHEIKNPLHSMVINLEVLRRRVERAASDGGGDMLRYVGVLGDELERVNHRIEILLRLARPERWAEPATLNEVVADLADLLRLEGRHHEVDLRLDLETAPTRLAVPRDSTRQAVLNLALATLHALPRGAALSLRTRHGDDGSRLIVEGTNAAGEPVSFDDVDASDLGATRMVADAAGFAVETPPDGTLVLVRVDPD